MKKILLMIIVLTQILVAHEREMMMQVVNSNGDPISKYIRLYKLDNLETPYRSGWSDTSWTWTAPNANMAADMAGDTFENPTWPTFELGTYRLRIDNRYTVLTVIGADPDQAFDFSIRYEDEDFSFVENLQGAATITETRVWEIYPITVHNYVSQSEQGVVEVNGERVLTGDSVYLDVFWQTHEFYAPDEYTDNKFRNWENLDEKYSRLNIQQSLDTSNSINSYYQPVLPLTVTNNLEGGSGGTYSLYWNAAGETTDPINSGDIYYAFENRDPTFDEYDIIADPSFEFDETTWHFLNWSDDVTAAYRNNEEITSGNKDFTALYKGNLRSNTENALSGSGQRKMVRTSDGKLHLVYTSMGRVWYEYSSNGTDWSLSNIDFEDGSSAPSIDFYENMIVIAYRTGSDIHCKIIDTDTDDEIGGAYITNSNSDPVVAFGGPFTYFIGFINSNDQIEYYIHYVEPDPLGHPGWHGYISGNNKNLSVVGDKSSDVYTFTAYHLVWQNAGTKFIKYTYLALEDVDLQGPITTPSDGSGYSTFYNPTIALIDGVPHLTFVGKRYEEIPPVEIISNPNNNRMYLWVLPPKGGGGTSGWVERALFRKYNSSTGSWSSFRTAEGSDVKSCDISDVESGGYIYSYTYDSGFNGIKTKIRTSTSYSKEIGNSRNFHLANGSNFSNTYGIDVVYGSSGLILVGDDGTHETTSNTEPPFSLRKTLSPTSAYKISAGENVNIGREAVLSKDSVQFYFALGAVKVDGEQIGYVDVPDTIVVKNKHHWDDFLMTEPFTLTDASSFSFGVMYGVADSADQETALSNGEHIKFKLQLIDEEAGKVIGEYENIKFSEKNPIGNKVYDQVVETDGIGNKIVRLKMEIKENIKPVYTIGNLTVADSSVLKASAKGIPYQGNLLVKDYALIQNYPNPFNPTTIIKYQLPKEGNVKLRIFDILGREIKTLVNDFQREGRYEVKFNAEDLASGVYIYRLESNDYVNSKKMLLLK